MHDTTLHNQPDIEAWLRAYGVKNYTINPDMSVDVKGDVNLDNKGLDFIAVQFNYVSGNFLLDTNRITSLLGSPKILGEGFYCAINQLTSLQHAPKIVPKTFDCSGNQLRTLQHCPEFVGRLFGCNHNNLDTLEFCPAHVGSGFYCQNNPLLGSSQDIIDFGKIMEIHLIQAELALLQKNILSTSPAPIHKI